MKYITKFTSVFSNFAKTFTNISKSNNVFPYIQITGPITRQTSIQVQYLLNLLPSNTQKLGIVINSNSGSVSQAEIIKDKLLALKKSKNNNLQILTFVQEQAVNAGYLLATAGQKIYVDRISILGGIEVGLKKFKLGHLIDRVQYKNSPTFESQIASYQSMSQDKKQQMERVFSLFSQNIKQYISSARKLSSKQPQTDLQQIYFGQQAIANGLADQIGRLNQIMKSYQIKKLEQSKFVKLRNDLKKSEFW